MKNDFSREREKRGIFHFEIDLPIWNDSLLERGKEEWKNRRANRARRRYSYLRLRHSRGFPGKLLPVLVIISQCNILRIPSELEFLRV